MAQRDINYYVGKRYKYLQKKLAYITTKHKCNLLYKDKRC